MQKRTSGAVVVVLLAVLLVLLGCSRRPRDVARVKGKVTLGGQALADAMVTFAPTGKGSSSLGKTNASGEYVLQHSPGVDGAHIGEHEVYISTRRPGDPGAKPPIAEVPEKVPFKYRTPGPDQLKATVNAGQNTIDFTLEPGPIDPPQPKGKKKK